MRRSLIISGALHVAVLAWALISFPSSGDVRARQTPALPIDVVSTSEFTKIKAGQERKTKKAAAKAKRAKPPAKKAKRKARRVKTARAPKAQKKTVKREATPKRKTAKARPKPPKKKMAAKPPPKAPARSRSGRSFDTDRIAALLNKVPDTAPKPAAPKPKVEPPKPAAGRSTGRDLTMSLSDIDALRARISQCWSPPVGGSGADALRVRLRLQLNRDGTLSSPPSVLSRESGSPFFQAAAESAVRAVWQCQPYSLPSAKYALWRDMVLNFDPREMFGG